jgi:tetratricopeptide (TPR) repeat protein
MDYILNYRKGFILTMQGENDAALEYLQKAVEISAGKNHDASYGQAVAQLGYAYVKTGDFVQAIEHLDAASEILHRIGDERGLQYLYTHMAVYYSRRGDREKALDQQKKALEASIARKDTIWIISSHVNLMSSYAILGDVEKAFYHYRERNRIIDLIEYPEDRKLDLNIGVLYVQSGQYAKALEILELCQQYYIKEGNTYRVALIDHWKALAYRGLDRYDLAAQKSLAAFDGARENDNKKLAELSAYTLFQTYHWRGRDGDAIKWLVTSNEIKDAIQSEEKEKEMLALETKYETFRKEQEIEMLKAKSETERVKRNQLLIG